MPILTNEIVATGPVTYDFDEMVGPLVPKSMQLEVIARPGVDGQEFRETGIRATSSRLRTTRYYTDRAAAITALTAYVNLHGETVAVTMHDEAMGNYVVERVSQAGDVQAVVNVANSVQSGTPQARMAVDWQLRNVT